MRNMCKQKNVVKKIVKAGELNGFAVELAEAQMQDYLTLKRDVDSVREDVAAIKLEQSRQGGMIEAIFNRLNSPVEQERKDGIFWYQVKSMLTTVTGKIFILLFIGCIALAGQRILELIGLIK